MSAETKVGLFFCLGMFILGVLTLKVEHFDEMFQKKYELKTYFTSAGGLKKGDSVSVAGVKVGEVTDVRLEDGKVAVVMSINEGVPIKSDAVAMITVGSLLGGKYVDISHGSQQAPVVEPGGMIRGKDTPDVNALLEKIELAVGGIGELTRSFQQQFEGSQEFFDTLRQSGPKLNKTLTALQEITEKIRSGEGTIGKLVYDDSVYQKAEDIAAALRTASEKLAKILTENEKTINESLAAMKETMPELKASVASLKSIAAKIDKGEGTVGKLVNDPQLYEDLSTTVATVRTLLAKVEKGEGPLGNLLGDEKFFADAREAVANLNSVAAKIDSGKGTLGMLINDPSLFEEMKKIVEEGREAVRGAKEQIPVGAFTSVLFSAF